MLSLHFIASSLIYRHFDAVSATEKHSFLITTTTLGKAILLPDKQDDSYNLFPDHDLLPGYELRLTAYKDAWLKCLARI